MSSLYAFFTPALPAARRHRAGDLLRAVLFLPGALLTAAAGEPDPLEAISAGQVQALYLPGVARQASSPRAVRAAGRDLAPVGADGSYRAEGLPVGEPFRLEIVGDLPPGPFGSQALTDPITIPSPGPAPGQALPLDLEPPFGRVAPRRGAGLTAPDGVRSLAFGFVGARATLTPTVRDSDGHSFPLSLSDPGVVLRSTDPAVLQLKGTSAQAAARGRAWALFGVDGEEGAVSVDVDLAFDSDRDGMPDWYEDLYGLNLADPSDAARDNDQDGLTNLQESQAGTDPRKGDTDEDGLLDRTEVLILRTDPLRPDTDGDGGNDFLEVSAGTDPRNPNERPGPAFTPGPKGSTSLVAPGVRIAFAPSNIAVIISSNARLATYLVDPTSFLISLRDTLTLTGTLSDVAVDSGRAYVAAGSAGLHIVDVQNPADLSTLSTITGIGAVFGVAVGGGRIFLATDSGLRILEPSGPDQWRTASTLALPGVLRIAWTPAPGLAYLGDSASNQLVVVNVTDPAAPRLLQRFNMPAGLPRFASIVALGTRVYVAHGTAGAVVLSAERPDDLQLVGTSQQAVPNATVNALAVLGNMIVVHDDRTASKDRGQICRIDDDGRITFSREIALGGNGSSAFALRQGYLLSLSADANVTVSQVLPRPDTVGSPPTGTLVILGPALVSPSSTVTLDARIRDDIYAESVDFLVDGVLRARDTVPPFRFTLKVDALPPPPREILVEAIGRDLANNVGPVATAVVRVVADLDLDGIPDPLDFDRDGDGIRDLEELVPGTDGFASDPLLADTDGDGISDGEESVSGSDGVISSPSSRDGDGDLLTDNYETAATETDPLLGDTDGDGIADGDEDPDSDGLSNVEELVLGTQPKKADTDADGLADGLESRLGLSPLDGDSDHDGTRDGDEDSDGDGLSNLVEISRSLDPLSPDSDGDGVGDGDELAIGTDPSSFTDFASTDVRVEGTTFNVHAHLTVRSMAVVNGVVTAFSGTSGPATLDLNVSGLLRVDAASRIDVVGRGFAGGLSPGNPDWRGIAGGLPRGDPGTGGSHGGRGGLPETGEGIAQVVHGRFQDPSLAGGGGCARPDGGRGGSGGGVVRIAASRIQLDGVIDAGGEGAGSPAYGGGRAGAGAGGSIRITAGKLEGQGEIRADGGVAILSGGLAPGGGGGGRILIDCDDLTGFDRSKIHARGGGIASGPPLPEGAGGAGTVSFRRTTLPLGELVVSNGGLLQSEPRTELPSVGEGTIASLTDNTLTRSEGPFPPAPHDLVGLFIDPDADDGDATTFRVLAQDGATLTTEPGLLARGHPGGRFRGAIGVGRLTVTAGGALLTADRLAVEDLSAPQPFTLSGGEVHAAELKVAIGGSLKILNAVLDLERVVGTLAAVEAVGSSLDLLLGLDCPTLTLNGTVFSTSGPLRVDTLTMLNSILTVPPSEAGTSHPLQIEVEGTLSLDAPSAIDLAGKGFVGGLAGGNSSASGETAGGVFSGGALAGGSHAGRGGHAGPSPPPDGEVPLAHGDLRDPVLPGGGGSALLASGVPGGNGGGLVRIAAEEVVLDGLIDVTGAGVERPDLFATEPAGAGAGGGVLIACSALRGAGRVKADGGSALRGTATPGGGGGGRIAILAADLSGFTGTLSARGGGLSPSFDRPDSQGGAGTVFVAASAGASGELTIDNGGRAAPQASTPLAIAGQTQLSLTRLRVRGAAGVAAALPVLVGSADREGPGRFSIVGSYSGPRLDLPPVAALEISQGSFDVQDLRLGGPLSALRLTGASVTVWQALTAGELSLAQSTMTVPDSTKSVVYPLNLTVSGRFSIDASSALRLAGKGHLGGMRGGNTSILGHTVGFTINTTARERSGGSHAGLGGYYGTGQLGVGTQPVYGHYRDPQHPGSGGCATASGAPGYNGGGVTRITAGELVLDGLIDVQGDGKQLSGSASPVGGGAGGSIFIDADVVRGAGEISADGGSADFDGAQGAGTGGGGRIAIFYGSLSGFTGKVHAYGGALIPAGTQTGPIGGAGTVFFKGDSQAYGDLLVDNAGRVQATARTILRGVGTGTITSLAANTLRGDKSFPTSDVKATDQWVVVNGAVLKPFRITNNNLSDLFTAPEDGTMTDAGAVGNPYQGAIVLDNLTVRGAGAYSTRRSSTFGYDLIIITTGSAVITDRGQLDAPPVVHW